jgi:tRNA(Ile2) C34 agmatinyltransferase TiaS
MGIWDEIIESYKVEKTLKNEKEKVVCIEKGAICPQCASANLSYDGKLNLKCPSCGYEISVGFT